MGKRARIAPMHRFAPQMLGAGAGHQRGARDPTRALPAASQVVREQEAESRNRVGTQTQGPQEGCWLPEWLSQVPTPRVSHRLQ